MSEATKRPEPTVHHPGPVYVVNIPGYSITDALQMKFQKYKSLPVMIRRQTRWCRWRKKGILQIVFLQCVVAALFFLGHLVLSKTRAQKSTDTDYKLSVPDSVNEGGGDTLQSIIAQMKPIDHDPQQWGNDVRGQEAILNDDKAEEVAIRNREGLLTLGQLAQQELAAKGQGHGRESAQQQMQPNAVAFDQFVQEVAVAPPYMKQALQPQINLPGVNQAALPMHGPQEVMQQGYQGNQAMQSPQHRQTSPHPLQAPDLRGLTPVQQPNPPQGLQAPDFQKLRESVDILAKGGHNRDVSRNLYKQLAMLGVLQAQMADASVRLKEMVKNQEMELMGD